SRLPHSGLQEPAASGRESRRRGHPPLRGRDCRAGAHLPAGRRGGRPLSRIRHEAGKSLTMATRPAAAPAEIGKADWIELFREGRTLYSVLVMLGTALHALQILVIAIVMPTVVADIGGAAYYT